MMSPETRAALGVSLTPEIATVLARTPRRLWGALAILLESESGTARVMSRAGLSSWLRAHDLRELAREADSRRVPRGALLILSIGPDGPFFRAVLAPPKGTAP